jgi:hypothetical protein
MFSSFTRIFLWIPLLYCSGSQYGTNYDSTCTCASVSSNGNVCLQYTCTTTQRVTACFPGRSLVITENGLKKSLSNVTIGERVLVVNKENKLVYEPIYAFIHLKRNGLFDFLSINLQYNDHLNSTTSFLVSANHLVFVANDKKVQTAAFAGELHVNDRIKYIYQNRIISAKIQSIHLIKEEGYYAPLTSSGTIVIDNVLASNYATVNNHDLAHSVMKIYRWWIYLFGSLENNENVPWILRKLQTIVQWYGIEKFGQTSIYDGIFHVSAFI